MWPDRARNKRRQGKIGEPMQWVMGDAVQRNLAGGPFSAGPERTRSASRSVERALQKKGEDVTTGKQEGSGLVDSASETGKCRTQYGRVTSTRSRTRQGTNVTAARRGWCSYTGNAKNGRKRPQRKRHVSPHSAASDRTHENGVRVRQSQ